MEKYPVIYHKTRIMVPYPRNPRKGFCDICGKSRAKGEIKTTQLHHWYYKYETETVQENPLLALENSIEVCFGCHKIADWLRAAITETKPENFDRIILTASKMPDWMKKRFTKICRMWLEEIKNEN